MPFDYQVEHYDKSGKVIRSNPYRMVIDSEGKRMERPPGSGIWYAEDGSIIKDESAAIEAVKAAAVAKEKELLEAKAKEAREKLKEELRAEILAEQQQKGQKNGHSSKN